LVVTVEYISEKRPHSDEETWIINELEKQEGRIIRFMRFLEENELDSVDLSLRFLLPETPNDNLYSIAMWLERGKYVVYLESEDEEINGLVLVHPFGCMDLDLWNAGEQECFDILKSSDKSLNLSDIYENLKMIMEKMRVKIKF